MVGFIGWNCFLCLTIDTIVTEAACKENNIKTEE